MDSLNNNKVGIMIYNIMGNTWQKVANDIPSISCAGYDESKYIQELVEDLVECNGNIYRVIVHGFFIRQRSKCFEVYIRKIEILKFKALAIDQIQQEGYWRHVTQFLNGDEDQFSIFEDLTCIQVNDIDNLKIVCIGHGDQICVSNERFDFTLLYNIQSHQWSSLVQCRQLPSFPHKIACGLKI